MRKSQTATILSFILALALGSTTLHAESAAAPAAPASAGSGVVNVNTADAVQFAHLPRLGPKAGERIVAYRKENGPFKKTTDLMQVKGIGDKTFQLIAPYLVLDGKTTLSTDLRSPRTGTRSKARASATQSTSSRSAQ